MLEESSEEKTDSFFAFLVARDAETVKVRRWRYVTQKRFASRAVIPGSSSNKSSKSVKGEKRRPGNSDLGRLLSLGCKGQPDRKQKQTKGK